VLAWRSVTRSWRRTVYQQELKKIPTSFPHEVSFLPQVLGTLKKLGGFRRKLRNGKIAMQDHYPDTANRVYYPLTEAAGKLTMRSGQIRFSPCILKSGQAINRETPVASPEVQRDSGVSAAKDTE
jgi:hypothetical protein